MGNKRKREGAQGKFPAEGLEWRHPIVSGRVYRVSPLSPGVPMFDPDASGQEKLLGPGTIPARTALGSQQLAPGDSFLAIECVDRHNGIPGSSDETWLVLCNGALCKVLLSEWVLRGVLEVSE